MMKDEAESRSSSTIPHLCLNLTLLLCPVSGSSSLLWLWSSPTLFL
jgi:hypothetical protein